MSRVLAVLGPTASGKTDMAVSIAERVGGEVISVDSMQVYRGLDIGAAKPTLTQRRGVAHHMIDVAAPEDEFSVAEFRRQGRAIIESADVPLVIAGGSGLHFRALVDPMRFAPTDSRVRAELEQLSLRELVAALEEADSDSRLHVDLANRRRVVRAVEILTLTGETPAGRAATAEARGFRSYVPEIRFTAIGVDSGDLLGERAGRRLGEMRASGLVSEVRSLRRGLSRTARRAVGYREVLAFLDGEITEDEAFDRAARSTRKLARRQRTWFRRDPRIRWLRWRHGAAERVELALEALS